MPILIYLSVFIRIYPYLSVFIRIYLYLFVFKLPGSYLIVYKFLIVTLLRSSDKFLYLICSAAAKKVSGRQEGELCYSLYHTHIMEANMHNSYLAPKRLTLYTLGLIISMVLTGRVIALITPMNEKLYQWSISACNEAD